MWIDSHCHLHLLDLPKLGLNLSEVIANAINNKVNYMLSVATHLNDHIALLEIAENFKQVKISAGLHPEYANEVINDYELFEKLLILANNPHVLAIGETGLDYYRLDPNQNHALQHKKNQRSAFIQQIHVAQTLQKPLIIHTRMAPKDTIDILKGELKSKELTGVMHCFTENWDLAKQALDLGLFISFSGIITFKNNIDHILEVVKKTPTDRILIETDSPYLAPVPFRGKQNQPSYVSYVGYKIAAIKNLDVQEFAQVVNINYAKLFKHLI
ncbi:MAG: TatD family hydrolase [Gammaproteobacteria bacterium]